MKKHVKWSHTLSFLAAIALAFVLSAAVGSDAFAYDDYWENWNTSSMYTKKTLEITSASVDSLKLKPGESQTIEFGVNPASADLEVGCGYCSSVGGAEEGCGDGCIDPWGYCSCMAQTVKRTTYIYAESSDTAVATVTYSGTTATVTAAENAEDGAEAVITARARLDAPSPKAGVEEPNRYGRQSAAKVINLQVEIPKTAQKDCLVTCYREAQYGNPPEGDSSDAGQHILATVTYDDDVILTDAEAAAEAITYQLQGVTTNWTDVTVSAEGNKLLVDGTISFAAYGGVIDLSCEGIPGVTVGGQMAKIDPVKTVAATGLAIEPVEIKEASSIAPAESTYQVTSGANLRSMNHVVWLTNKGSEDGTSAAILPFETNIVDQSTPAHHHTWFNFTRTMSANSIVGNTTKLNAAGYTVTLGEDGQFTIKANEVTPGEIISADVLDDLYMHANGLKFKSEVKGIASPEADALAGEAALAVINQINDLAEPEEMLRRDVPAVQEAVKAYEELSEEDQALIPQEVVDSLNAAADRAAEVLVEAAEAADVRDSAIVALAQLNQLVDEDRYTPASYAAYVEACDAFRELTADDEASAAAFRKARSNVTKAYVSLVLRTDLAAAVITGLDNVVYTGAAFAPEPVVTLNDKELVKDTDYTVEYANNKAAGTAVVTVTGKADYTGTAQGTFVIAKAANPAKAKASAKTVKFAKVKKAKQTVKSITVKAAQGKVTYAKTSGKFAVNKTTGAVTVPKKTKKGTYTMKVKVTAAGNANYNKSVQTVTFKIKVK